MKLPSNAGNVEISGATHAMPKRITVAYVVHSFGVGGLERCITRLVNGLDADRFAATVVSLDGEMCAADWIRNESVSTMSLHKRAGNDFSVILRLANVFAKNSIDLVHSHNWGTLVEATLARRIARVPIHLHAERGTVGGTLVARGLRHRLRAIAMRWCLHMADGVISNAASVGERVASRCGFPADRIHVIPNGVESLRLVAPELARCEIRRELGIDLGTPVVGSVGRLHSVKAFDVAIDAIWRIQEIPAPHLILVGSGPELQFLQQRAAALRVSNRVHLVGMKNDVERWLAAMDIYINTSVSEGMSQSIVEAMSVGLPMVVTDVGDNARLVNGPPSCGIVVEPRSVAQLERAIRALILGPERRAEFQQNAMDSYLRKHQLRRMIDDYQSLYLSFAAKRRRRSCP